MKKKYIVGNWKANQTAEQVQLWLDEVSQFLTTNYGEKEVIVCPPFIHLKQVADYVKEHETPLGIGAQDVSAFGIGAYTGEIPASLLREFASYGIIGHSERRSYLHETDSQITEKFSMANQAILHPIVCVQDAATQLPENTVFVAYEPVAAIGTGNPDTPENAEAVAKTIKEQHPSVQFVLYGGSVNSGNVASFTMQDNIDGVLVGKASLVASEFCKIIANA